MFCFVVTFFVQLSDTFAMKIETKKLESAWRGGLRMMAVLEWGGGAGRYQPFLDELRGTRWQALSEMTSKGVDEGELSPAVCSFYFQTIVLQKPSLCRATTRLGTYARRPH